MNITARTLGLLIATLAALAGCTNSNYTVGGLGTVPGGAYTPGSNINPLSPGIITSER